MKKFLVLNQSYQPMHPLANGFTQVDPYQARPLKPEDNLLEEAEARAFAEHLAAQMPAQSFHLVEVKGTAKAKPPVEWT